MGGETRPPIQKSWGNTLEHLLFFLNLIFPIVKLQFGFLMYKIDIFYLIKCIPGTFGPPYVTKYLQSIIPFVTPQAQIPLFTSA